MHQYLQQRHLLAKSSVAEIKTKNKAVKLADRIFETNADKQLAEQLEDGIIFRKISPKLAKAIQNFNRDTPVGVEKISADTFLISAGTEGKAPLPSILYKVVCSEKKSQYMKLSPEMVIELIHKHYGYDGIAGLKMELLRAGETAQYRNNTIYGYFDAKELLATFDVNYDELADTLRKRAKIPGKKLRYSKKKLSNLIDETKALQHSKHAI